MAQAKPIKQLIGKAITAATIEDDDDLLMLALTFSDGTTFSLELWPRRPKTKLNMLPAQDGAKPIRIKL